jgi:hypothetical protein
MVRRRKFRRGTSDGNSRQMRIDPRRQVSSIGTSSRVLVAAASLRQLLLVAAVDASLVFATMINELDTPEGLFPLEVWRFERSLRT